MSLSDRSGRDDARLKHYKPLKVLDERGSQLAFSRRCRT